MTHSVANSHKHPPNAEATRLEEAREGASSSQQWGPYLSERQWGTVREGYSTNGDAWNFFTHDHARSRAYRWGEDGLGGISDDKQHLCFAIALWNGKDPILKERLFGLTNSEGNHGEDVKEYYFYLDSTPTHSYMKFLYKYPHAAYPYSDLVETNLRRSRGDFEYELLDTGVFNEDRYHDVFVEYAKAAPDDILIRITVHNRGPDEAELHILPTRTELYKQSGQSLFQNPHWHRIWWDHLGYPGGWEPYTVAAYAEGRLVALVPLATSRAQGIRWLEWAGMHAFDYPVILIAAGVDPLSIWRAIKGLGGYDVARLRDVRADGNSVAALQRLARETSRPSEVYALGLSEDTGQS